MPDDLELLNPYAVQGRYEILGPSAEDITESIIRVKNLRGHVEDALEKNQSSEGPSDQIGSSDTGS